MLSKFKFWWSYHFPYYDWWKARKYVKRPHIHFNGCKKYYEGWFFRLPARIDYFNPIISIETSNVGWKSKYDSPRWEYNPYIAIILFRKWAISWTIGWKDYMQNLATWEAILDYNYYDRPITSQTGWLNIDGNNMILETLKK